MFTSIKRALGLEAKSTLAAPSPELIAMLGARPTASGVAVSPETAMRCPTVFGSIKILGEAIAQLPLIVYRRGTGEEKSRATDHPLYELLHDQPNPWTSAFEFRRSMQTAILLHGNAFAYINRSGGKIIELIQLPSTSVSIKVDTVTLEPTYVVSQSGGGQRTYSPSEIFHLREISTSDVGLSPVQQMRESIGLSLAMEQHAARIFGNGARPSGVFKYGKSLGSDTLRRLRESFHESHAGENSGRTLVLEDGMDFEAIQFNSVDLQFLEMRRHQVAEIARGFRVPLHLLQELERATFANAESMGQQFISLTLLPWLKNWEGAIRRSLLTKEERAEYFAEFLTDDLARADIAARFSAYSQAISARILNPNEVRAMENRAPYAGGEVFANPNIDTGAAADQQPKPKPRAVA